MYLLEPRTKQKGNKVSYSEAFVQFLGLEDESERGKTREIGEKKEQKLWNREN